MNSAPSFLARFVAPALIVLSTTCASAVNAEEYFKSYSITGRANVNIRADDASVRVVTSDTPQVEFRVKYEGSDWGIGFGGKPHFDSQQNGDRVELTVYVNSKVVIGVSTRRASIEVRMPRNADLQLETGDGDIELSSLDGNILARSGDGRIKASQLSGTMEIVTGDGEISVDTLKGGVRLHSGDGAIRGAHLDGKCDASSGDGSIHLEGRFDALDIKSGDGDLFARVGPGSTMSSTWSIRTGDGAVDLTLPTDIKANLEASTNDGHITLGLPVAVQGNIGSHIRGTINGGGPSLLIHTSDGAIRINGT
jgi:DUF4097 and DUF4098 domain-containing protein YvlB